MLLQFLGSPCLVKHVSLSRFCVIRLNWQLRPRDNHSACTGDHSSGLPREHSRASRHRVGAKSTFRHREPGNPALTTGRSKPPSRMAVPTGGETRYTDSQRSRRARGVARTHARREEERSQGLERGSLTPAGVWCEVCGCGLNSNKNFEVHVLSPAHRRRAADAAGRGRVGDGATDATDATDQGSQGHYVAPQRSKQARMNARRSAERSQGLERGALTPSAAWCEVCGCSLTSNQALEAHVLSARHRRRAADAAGRGGAGDGGDSAIGATDQGGVTVSQAVMATVAVGATATAHLVVHRPAAEQAHAQLSSPADIHLVSAQVSPRR